MPIIRVNISKEFSQLPDSEEEKKNPPIASQLRNIFTRKTTTKIKERSGFDIYQFQLVVKRREEERKGAT